ncbi:MAG: HEAT repeat domain-containing protein, partial [Coriobacteriales bacterium]|nr:HEAT repeat domain-containing protein [Coriobacteriales bacterium]
GAAIRNLGVALGDSEGVAEAAAAAMMDAGFSEQATSVVFSLCAPTQVLAAPSGLPAEGPAQSPADQVRLMLGPVEPSESNGVEDQGLLELRTSAESGTSDAEVLAALVTLVELDPSDERIGHAADLIEGLMALVVKRGDVEAAAQAVDVLTRVSERSDLPEAASLRIANAIASMSKPSDLRTLLDLARSASAEDLDREAAARMLEAIGDKAIEPMLEVLADEEDMATRKRLVEVLSSIADAHIPQIASHLADPRWYFVRNVVAVLGSARRSATLPYLQRTIRHGDARVRRETIRAIRQLPDRLATEMLVAALDDDDAQNVQLAAQSIGMRNDAFAVPGLATLAGGEGRGNREIAVRLEAVEALARIGSADALRVLDEVAGRRGLLSGGRAREVARAAEAAAARLRSAARS